MARVSLLAHGYKSPQCSASGAGLAERLHSALPYSIALLDAWGGGDIIARERPFERERSGC